MFDEVVIILGFEHSLFDISTSTTISGNNVLLRIDFGRLVISLVDIC